MGSGWSEEKFADYKLQQHTTKSCLTAWELIELVGGSFSRGLNHQTVSMGISEVFQELILDVLKQVRGQIYVMILSLLLSFFSLSCFRPACGFYLLKTQQLPSDYLVNNY